MSDTRKVYEIRYYQVAAEDAGKFKALASENVPLRAKRSRLTGFWATELGAVNHVLHMWEYDSLEHRKAVRDEMYGNTEWANFLSQASPMFQTMDNWLCRPLLGNFNAAWSDKEYYKLTTVRYQCDGQLAARKSFLTSVERHVGHETVKAALETVIGNGREFHLIESATSLQDLLTDEDGPFDEEVNVSIESKLLFAYPWNKWTGGSV